MNSYSVRCIVEIPKEEINSLAYLYEERITTWLATDIDQAIDKAVTEVKDYCEANGYKFTGLSQAYWMIENTQLNGVEVFSLLRESNLPSEEYLDAFFSTGDERMEGKRKKTQPNPLNDDETNEAMNATDDLLAKLIELKAILRRPPGGEEVTDAEKALGSKFPDGIRDFYRFSNGVQETTSDDHWDFYSIEKMIDRTKAYRAQDPLVLDDGEIVPFTDLVCFCDVAIELNSYLFCGNPQSGNFGKFFGKTHNLGWFVANSYEEFVRIFLQQHGELILGV